MQAINPRNLPSLSTMPQPTPEYIYAEKPTIDQLISMGWQYIEGSWDQPPSYRSREFQASPN